MIYINNVKLKAGDTVKTFKNLQVLHPAALQSSCCSKKGCAKMSAIFHNISSNTTEKSQENVCNVCFGILIFLLCVEVIIFVVQFVGNGLVIWTVFVTPSLRSSCMIFICNLAIADFLNGFLVIPIAVLIELYILIEKEILHFWLDLCLAFGYVFYTVSMLNLTFMSIDRCMAIVKPMKYKVLMTTNRVKTIIVGTWLGGIFIGTVEGFKLLSREACFLTTIIVIAIVYLIIVISYAILIRKLKRQDRVRAQMVSAAQDINSAQRRRDQKLAKTIGLVIGVFTVSWCLLAYTMLFPPINFAYSLLFETWGHLFGLGVCLSFTSTAINPLIYFFQSISMKNAAKDLIVGIISCNR